MFKKLLSFFILFTLTVSFFLNSGCKKNPVTPPDSPDTTSHNYTWQKFILGDGNSSILYDVEIINENLIYAVGQIYIKDSTGQDYIDYNAAVWDGIQWNLLKIPTIAYGDIMGVFPIITVSAFSSNSIMTFSDAGSYSYWNGTKWTTQFVNACKGGGEKLWGTSITDLDLSGTNGSFSYYNGSIWRLINLGTNVTIHDIWGTKDSNTKITEVYAPVSDLINDGGIKKIFRIKGTLVDTIPWNTGKNVISVWADSQGKMYAAGDGLYVRQNDKWQEIPEGRNKRFVEIRGDASNNIFTRGPSINNEPNVLIHYNGLTWKIYNDFDSFINRGMAVKGKTVVVVGDIGNRAIAVIGKRED